MCVWWVVGGGGGEGRNVRLDDTRVRAVGDSGVPERWVVQMKLKSRYVDLTDKKLLNKKTFSTAKLSVSWKFTRLNSKFFFRNMSLFELLSSNSICFNELSLR